MPRSSRPTIHPHSTGCSPWQPFPPEPNAHRRNKVRKADYDRRVFVTGLGAINSVGNDVDTAGTNLVNGASALGPISRLDRTPYEAKLTGEVKDFVASDSMHSLASRRSES